MDCHRQPRPVTLSGIPAAASLESAGRTPQPAILSAIERATSNWLIGHAVCTFYSAESGGSQAPDGGMSGVIDPLQLNGSREESLRRS